MKRFAIAAAAAGLAGTAVVGVAAPSSADTAGCASRTEYDNLVHGLTVNQVANRFDIYGYYLDDTNTYFRRGYKTCWAPGTRRIVIEFSYDTGGSIDWYVRDV